MANFGRGYYSTRIEVTQVKISLIRISSWVESGFIRVKEYPPPFVKRLSRRAMESGAEKWEERRLESCVTMLKIPETHSIECVRVCVSNYKNSQPGS